MTTRVGGGRQRRMSDTRAGMPTQRSFNGKSGGAAPNTGKVQVDVTGTGQPLLSKFRQENGPLHSRQSEASHLALSDLVKDVRQTLSTLQISLGIIDQRLQLENVVSFEERVYYDTSSFRVADERSVDVEVRDKANLIGVSSDFVKSSTLPRQLGGSELPQVNGVELVFRTRRTMFDFLKAVMIIDEAIEFKPKGGNSIVFESTVYYDDRFANVRAEFGEAYSIAEGSVDDENTSNLSELAEWCEEKISLLPK